MNDKFAILVGLCSLSRLSYRLLSNIVILMCCADTTPLKQQLN